MKPPQTPPGAFPRRLLKARLEWFGRHLLDGCEADPVVGDVERPNAGPTAPAVGGGGGRRDGTRRSEVRGQARELHQ